MRSSRQSKGFRPFENLKALLDKNSMTLAAFPSEKPKPTRVKSPIISDKKKLLPEDEHQLFIEAMKGVTPLKQNKVSYCSSSTHHWQHPEKDSESDILAKLNNLVCTGEGFIIADTPEYQEGIGHNVHPDIARRLHRGDFSIQDHIDLHGFTLREANEAFEQFMKKSISQGKKAVLIVHGRGLSSPKEPVLKNNIIQWLSSGKWRKWVIAYTSARSCDGGLGATYVLLRETPLTKRHLRKKPW